MKRIALVFLVALTVPTTSGCTPGVPVSQVFSIELKDASEHPSEGKEPLLLDGTEREIYVAKEPLLTNKDISTVEKSYDAQGNPAITLNFTESGSKAMSSFTKQQGDVMIALVVNGTLMLAVSVKSEIKDSAMISGGMSRAEVDRLYAILTASEVRIGKSTPTDTTEMPKPDYEAADVYSGLRRQVLELKPDAIGLRDTDQSGVFAVMMETGYPEAVATLVAVSDGTSSLYFSNGGGIIGSGEHEAVRKVAQSFIAMANDYVSQASATTAHPLPQKEHVRFYLITDDAIYTVEALEDDLGNERHPFSPLLLKGHELITAVSEHTPE